MTAFWTFLGNLSPVDWALIFAAWLIIAAALGTFTGLAIRRADRQSPPPPDDVVTVQRVLPPVPPTRSELAWLRDQPVEVLTGIDLQWRFDDVIQGRDAERAGCGVTAQVAADLRAAAEVLRRDGWAQGGLDPHGRHCIVEACFRATDGVGRALVANDAVRKLVGQRTQVWNDAPGRTADEVIAALLAAADAAEATS